MKPFNFCPACGAPIDPPDEAEGSRCPSCRRSWYRNPSPAASAVIVEDGRALVVVRGMEPGKGRYDSPGGFLHAGEDALDAVKREIREELGIEVEIDDRGFLGAVAHQYGDEDDWVLSLGYKARIRSGVPDAADDVAAIEWVAFEQLDDLDFAWEHNREQTRKALESERRGA